MKKIEVFRSTPKIYYFCYTPSSKTFKKKFHGKTVHIAPREVSVTSLKDSYLELCIEITQKNFIRFAKPTGKCISNTGPIDLYTDWKLTTGTEKQVELLNLLLLFVIVKLLASFENGDDLSKLQLMNNTSRRKVIVRTHLKDVFAFV